MSLSQAIKELHEQHIKEVHERRKKYANRKSIEDYIKRTSLSVRHEDRNMLNYLGIFTTFLNNPESRAAFVRKVVSSLKSPHHAQQNQSPVSVEVNRRFVRIDSLGEENGIHLRYTVQDVCDMDVRNGLTGKLFFFVVLDTLKPIAVCHLFAAEKESTLQKLFRYFKDRIPSQKSWSCF